MFTGIIEAVGHVVSQQNKGVDTRLQINTGKLDLSDVQIGDSIAISGVCLTAVELLPNGFWADVSAETLQRTCLGDLTVNTNTAVNLEKALTPSTRLGGHLVSGHVDGIGKVVEFYQDGRSWRLAIEVPQELARYIAEKGSICIDGISLTVNRVVANRFELNIIPHTLDETTISGYQPGRLVNLEVDIIARYIERLLLSRESGTQAGVSLELLKNSGFISNT